VRQALASRNTLRLSFTNYGLLGTNFTYAAPSLEYPQGSSYDHMPRAGLWVGAVRAGSGDTLVTTATLDINNGSNAILNSEFRPSADDNIYLLSSLVNDMRYSPDGVSEMDYVTQYDDLSPAGDGTVEPHRPLGIQVRQSIYSWSFSSYSHILFLHYVIRNVSAGALQNVYVGLYSEFASGNRSGNLGYSNWYRKKWLVYDPDLRLIREHYCQNQPVPAACQLQLVPYWVGAQLLTPPDTVAGQRVTLAAWPWAAGSTVRDQDTERYAIMSAGTIANTNADSLMPYTGDPVELLALGPFATIAAGDSITVDFALVAGSLPEMIQQRAYMAQRAHDLGLPAGVVAAETSLLSADAGPDGVHLRWDVVSDPGTTARVERSGDGETWDMLAEVMPGASGQLDYLDRGARPGDRQAYRLGVLRQGAMVHTAPVWIDVPLASPFALHGARPNPATSRTGTVSFTLAESGPARLECFDLLGRREARLDLGVLGPGEHLVPLARFGSLRPAVHVLRLTQAGKVATTRIVTMP
jgi:hypothetical protein